MTQVGTFGTSMPDLINCLADTIDLVSPQLADHHQRVGWIAHALAAHLDLPEDLRLDLYFAGNLHDIGALSLTGRVRLLSFEEDGQDHHGETGALLLEMYSPLAQIGEMVRFHHVKWADGAGAVQRHRAVPLGSHVLHLADRISVLIGTMDGIHLLTRVPEIRARIIAARGSTFAPLLVDAFLDLAGLESFWLGLAFPRRDRVFEEQLQLRQISLDTAGILELSRMFARIIDFRSHFTATHSSGVAASAEALALLTGSPAEEGARMRIAGLLHDLGKLAVPAELLEKPAQLSDEERALIRCHTYFTRRALENIPSFETITAWSADHHERIDGHGYPYQVGGGELSTGSRIMAVADVFTALTEDRPYRSGMDQATTRRVIGEMVAQQALDPDIVAMLLENYETLNGIRAGAQSEAVREYGEIFDKVAAVAADEVR